jgi:radical SAM protein with 4Fe4S-binding SPASM domain
LHLLTNGTLITEPVAHRLRDREISVQVSLDGSCGEVHDQTRGAGAFQRALAGLATLTRSGIRDITVATTVTARNYDDLDGLARLCRSLEVSLLRFLPLRRMGRGAHSWARLRPNGWPRSLDALYRRLFEEETDGDPKALTISSGLSGLVLDVPAECGDDLWCPLGTSLAIDAQGDSYPCAALMHPGFRVGNVFDQSLGEIQESEPYRKIVEIMAQRKEQVEDCAACSWKNLCQGGCMAMAVDQRGTPWAVDHHCGLRKRLFPEAFALVTRGALARRGFAACA